MSSIGTGGVAPWGTCSHLSRISRLLLLVAAVSAALLLAPAGEALAQTPGSLSQLASPNDCYQQNLDTSVTECGNANGTGLRGTHDVVVSPDGSNVYVVSPGDNAIAEFARAADGSLTEIGCIAPTTPVDRAPVSTCRNRVATGLYQPVAMVVSPDGQNVYVAARDSGGTGTIAELVRNPDGTLTQPSPNDCIAENALTANRTSDCADQSGHGIAAPTSLAISPDGSNLYGADGSTHAVAVFTRDNTGVLAQLNGPNDCIEDQNSSSGDCATKVAGIGDGSGSPSGNESGSPSAISVSPDGSSVYTAGFDSNERGLIAEFSRGAGGSLATLGCVESPTSTAGCSQTAAGITGFVGMVISPDGRNLYTASQGFGGPIAEFARAQDGSLSQLPAPNNCIEEGAKFGCGSPPDSNTGTGIATGYRLAISPDGASVYAAAPGSQCTNQGCDDVAEFSRGSATGALTQLGSPDNCIQEHTDNNTNGPNECGDETGHGLGGPGLAVSPDNKSVYVTGPSDIAEFARTPVPMLTVTRSGTGNGSITDDQGTISCPPTCSHAYPPGTQVTLTATRAPGSTFTGWSGGGCSGTGTCTVTMSSDMNVTATFDVVAQPAAASTLTVSKSGSGGGTVTDDKGGISCPPTCSHSYPTGTKVTLTANPANGSSFAGWNGGGCSGTGTCSVTLNSDTNVSATFNALPASGGPGSPSILSNKPAVNGSNVAGFSGAANPEGSTTFVFWQYGLDKRYTKAGGKGPDYTNATPRQQVGSDGSSHPVSTSVRGLLPNALYHVRMIAFNRNGSAIGPDQTFVTPSGPAPGPPTLGRSFDIAPVSGIVFIVIGHRLIPLTADTKIPAGSIIDALHGTVEIFTASGKKGKLYHGFFGGAVFRLTEAVFGADRGLTTLELVEGTFKGAPSYKSCQAHGAGDRGARAHTAVSSRILQTLHARATGRFRTRGRYAAGTVRGTRWTTSDRCDGTLLAVQLHNIVVQDFVKQFLLFLPQGHSYLAGPHSPPPPERQELTEPHNEGGEAPGP